MVAGVSRAWVLLAAVALTAACGMEESHEAEAMAEPVDVEVGVLPASAEPVVVEVAVADVAVADVAVPVDEIVLEQVAAKPGWRAPVLGPITSRFGPRPKGDGTEMHDALDVAAPMGTEVVAPADLRVVWIAYQTRAGRYLQADVLDEHGAPTGHRLTFAHLSSTAVFEGDRVKRGETLGLIGLSGSASGPHLHLKVEELRGGDRVAVDPLSLFEEAEIIGLSAR